MSQNVLVLGNGYLGSFLGDLLNANGCRVWMASKNGTGDCHEADLGSRQSIEELSSRLPGSPDFIVHCASSSRGGPDAYHDVFVGGINHLVDAFPGARVILTSSTSVYPQVDGEVVDESSSANPDRQTGQFLREAEEILLGAGGIVLRLAGIYGPSRSVHLSRMIEGTATIESGEVSRCLNQIHRDDAAGAIVHLIESNPFPGGEIFNVADDSPISQRECYESLAEILGKPVPPEAPPDMNRKRAWTHKQVSNEKLRSTGWIPQFPSFLEAVQEDERLLPSIEDKIR